MSSNQFIQFFNTLSSDEALRAKYESSIAGSDLEAGAPLIAAMATDAGHACTATDVISAFEAAGNDEGELSDDDLENVSGGGFWDVVTAPVKAVRAAETEVNHAGQRYLWPHLNDASNAANGK